ncbi:hypothetical protein NBRC111894_1218 [Sporolactobacillus inulinus]|uniref:Uncharacterized protein n=1 Tax=Sporolactobacillus inulinus TaxID=2078 RepID=A0A4Y1Z9H1_9BACL|nr:hypothetical protein NBRC111894_1218 [Sporolactobacillus inulinus]
MLLESKRDSAALFLQGKESCLVGTCPRSRPVDASRWSVVRTKGDESKA